MGCEPFYSAKSRMHVTSICTLPIPYLTCLGIEDLERIEYEASSPPTSSSVPMTGQPITTSQNSAVRSISLMIAQI